MKRYFVFLLSVILIMLAGSCILGDPGTVDYYFPNTISIRVDGNITLNYDPSDFVIY